MYKRQIQQGKFTYLAATGQTQQPFLGRWLLLVAALWGLSALAYAARLALAGRGSGRTLNADPTRVWSRRTGWTRGLFRLRL